LYFKDIPYICARINVKSDTQMFGINDPLIILPYLLSVVCVLFSAWFGVKYWNKDDEKDESR